MSLQNKVAVVVGGGAGIGRATAMLFAAEGAAVALFGRREALLADTVAAIRKAGGAALHVAGDIAREADVGRLIDATLAAHGGIDVLINAAAVRGPAALTDITPAEYEASLRTNLLGAFVVTRAVVAPM